MSQKRSKIPKGVPEVNTADSDIETVNGSVLDNMRALNSEGRDKRAGVIIDDDPFRNSKG